MDSWTLQVGYPVVTVTRDYDSGTANLTQVRIFGSLYKMHLDIVAAVINEFILTPGGIWSLTARNILYLHLKML